MIKTLLSILFILNVILPGNAQESHCHSVLSGKVLDGETQLPFANVSVFIKETERGALTDQGGQFRLEGLCTGKYTVIYSMLGYKSFTVQYSLTESIEDQIVLHTDSCMLQSVTVFGKKVDELESLTKSTLEGKALERTRGLALGEALKEISGINTLKTGSSIVKPILHGLHSNRIVLLNAGLRQEGQQWGNEHAPEIDPFVSDKFIVVKGAAGVRYGSDAIAGVVIIEPRSLPKSKSLDGEINLAGMSNNRQGVASGLLEGKFGKLFPLSWRVQGTYKRGGNVKTPHYYQANTGQEEKNFSYALGYENKWLETELFYSQFTSRLGIFSGAHIGNKADLLNAIERQRPAVLADFSYDIKRPFQNVLHELVRWKAIAKTSAGKINVQLGRQFNDRSEFDVLRNSKANADITTPQLEFNLTTYSADLSYEHNYLGNFHGTLGASYMHQFNIWEGRFLIPNYISNTYSLFALETWKERKWQVEAGIRFDYKELDIYQNKTGVVEKSPYYFSNGSGTIGFIYFLNKAISWQSNLGTTWRPPTVNELFSNGLHHGAAAIENGNPKLKFEQGLKGITSLQKKDEKGVLEIAFYYNHIKDFIYLRPDLEVVQTIRGAFPSFTYRQINARFFGTDVNLDYSLFKGFSLLAKSSLVFADNLTDNTYLLYTPPIRYSAGIKTSPFQSSLLKKYDPYLRLDFERVERQNRLPQNEDYAPSPKGYMLWNVEIGTDFKVGRQKWSASIQVTNLFDVAYRDYLNRFRYFTDEMGRNISFRLKMPFQINKPKI